MAAFGGHLFEVDSNVLDSATWHEGQSVVEDRSASDVLNWDTDFSIGRTANLHRDVSVGMIEEKRNLAESNRIQRFRCTFR